MKIIDIDDEHYITYIAQTRFINNNIRQKLGQTLNT